MRAAYRGILFSLISGAAWGTYGIFSTLLARRGVSQQILSMLGIVTILLYFALVTLRKPHLLRETPLWDMIGIMIGLGVSNLGTNLCYAGAFVNGMPTSVVSTVAFCNIPIVMIASAILFKNRITKGKILSTVIALIGVGMTLQGVQGTAAAEIQPMGIVYTCLIPIFFAQFSIINKYFIQKGRDANLVMMFQGLGSFTSSVVIMGAHPLKMMRELSELSVQDSSVLWIVAGFCLVPEIICYASQQEAFRYVEPAVFSICYAVDPVVATVLGFSIFHQKLAIIQLTGILAVIGAVGYLILTERDQGQPRSCRKLGCFAGKQL